MIFYYTGALNCRLTCKEGNEWWNQAERAPVHHEVFQHRAPQCPPAQTHFWTASLVRLDRPHFAYTPFVAQTMRPPVAVLRTLCARPFLLEHLGFFPLSVNALSKGKGKISLITVRRSRGSGRFSRSPLFNKREFVTLAFISSPSPPHLRRTQSRRATTSFTTHMLV